MVGRSRDVMTTDDTQRVDIRSLKKDGMLKPGTVGQIHYFFGDQQTGSVGFTAYSDRLELRFRYRDASGNWRPHVETLYLDHTPCNFGGTRPWFSCPGCGRRVAAVFGIGRAYRCRHCHQLPYTSQHEGERDRLLRRIQEIRKRLGASPNLLMPIFGKPKHMHWKTFDRLMRQEQALTQGYLGRTRRRLKKLATRLGTKLDG